MNTLKLRYWLAITVFSLSAFIVITWYAFFEDSWLSYQNLPWPVEGDVRPGEAVPLFVYRCNASREKKHYFLTHDLVKLDGTSEKCPGTTVLTPGYVSLGPGCLPVEKSGANVVPAGTCPGVYRIEGMALTRATVRAVDVPWMSQSFKVVSSPAASSP